MSLSDHYNATFTVDRLTKTGSDDGTPIYDNNPVLISGWFDGLETRGIYEPFRDESTPYADRRALFMCDVDSGILLDDQGTIQVGALDAGAWMVSVINSAPIPGGVGHLEVQLQGTEEAR